MRAFIITFTTVLWFIYILSSFIMGEFNFFKWPIDVRFLVGVFACLVGCAFGIAVLVDKDKLNNDE